MPLGIKIYVTIHKLISENFNMITIKMSNCGISDGWR